MVPNGAGGSIDLLTRAVADRLEGLLGQPVIVENRTGAAGVIGTQIVRVAPPDGYLLLASSSSSNTIAPHVQANVPYDGVRDFAPIINIAWTTKILVVNPALPVHTLAEFVAYAGARPGALNYSSTGIGSSAHLDIEMFSSMAGIHMVNIPYRTVGEQTAAVIANDAQFNVNSITQTSNMVRAGRLRALAVVAPRRSILLPDVPTIAEAGMPDLDFRTWSGLSAPRDTTSASIPCTTASNTPFFPNTPGTPLGTSKPAAIRRVVNG